MILYAKTLHNSFCMHFDAYANMHQNASACIKMHQSASECIKCLQNELCKCFADKFIKEVVFITFNQGKMHQYASECIKMHQNVCRMNYSNVLCMKFQFEKFFFFWLKMTNFFLSAQNTSICIRMHQNVCRMNCANFLCINLSKKWFLLHLIRIKCINMHQNASNCMKNELFSCFACEISI